MPNWQRKQELEAVCTCALELPGPHALPRGGALGAVGRLAAGLGAVAGEEDLPLVDPTVVLRRAADGAADAGALRTVGAPLALQGRLEDGGGRFQLRPGQSDYYSLDIDSGVASLAEWWSDSLTWCFTVGRRHTSNKKLFKIKVHGIILIHC